MVCGHSGNGMGLVQHLPHMPLLAAAASCRWRSLLYPLLGAHHWQRHALCPAGQSAFTFVQ